MLLSTLVTFISANNKAVLFAGSGGWENYRHQADIWTIYQDLIKRGFNKNEISIACFDDIAENQKNPYKGQIFHDEDHSENVYGGSDSLTYKDKITPQTFYDMLLNVGTNQNDNVFIYYDDHGGQGILSVPNEESGYISVKDLSNALIEMNNKRLFKNLLFIIEACNSGSIGQFIEYTLTSMNITNIAIITAARANESSLSDNYDKWISAPLSNQFTASFLDKIRESPDCSIDELFNYLETSTKFSVPLYFGDNKIKNLKISDFIRTTTPKIIKHKSKSRLIPQNLIDQYQYEYEIMKFNIKQSQKKKIMEDYHKKQKNTKRLKSIIDKVSNKIKSFISVKTIQQINEIDDVLTNDYFEIFDYFYKNFGPVPANDLSEISTMILKLSKIAPKHKILDAMNEISSKSD